MVNDNFYGYKRDPKKVKTKTGMRGSVDLDFESINPYEFKKGMNAELTIMGTELRESSEEQREKATETVIKNLQKLPAYYSLMEHYETVTRNMEGRKPTFNAFAKEMEGYKMKEVKEKFTIDKAIEIQLKESVRTEIRSILKEIFKNK